MKLDAKLKQLLIEHEFLLLDKSQPTSIVYDNNIVYNYISNDIIEFKLLKTEYSTKKIQYNFSTKEMTFTQEIDASHPVYGGNTIQDDSDEMWTIYSNLHCLNKKDTVSYINELEVGGILFYPNGDWEGLFDVEVYDRVVYTAGVYKYQILDANDKGHVASDTKVISFDFNTYEEFEAYMFQMETTQSFTEGVKMVVELMRDYHK